MTGDEWSDWTDEQLREYEEWLYDREVDGDDTWFQRDQILWEMNRRGFWLARIGLSCVAILVAVPALAADVPEIELSLGQVREVQLALSSIEKRDGVSIPTCLGDVKPPCIPAAISHAIADDIYALGSHLQFYNSQVHKLVGEASGGLGYVEPGSRQEATANYRLFDLNEQKVRVRLQPVDVHGLEASGVQLPPTIKAVLSPITR